MMSYMLKIEQCKFEGSDFLNLEMLLKIEQYTFEGNRGISMISYVLKIEQ